MTVSLMLLADERPLLEAQIREATGERVVWQVLTAELGALPIDGLLAIGIESSGEPRLKRLLGAAIERLGDEHCALLIWTAGRNPDLRMLRGSTPRTVLYLPGEVEGLLEWAEGAGGVGRPDDLIGILRSDLPGALAIALRHVLEASGHSSGPPPPCTVAELARTVRLDRANLHRRAREWGVDLPKLLLYSRARWVLARYRRPDQLPDIIRNLGHRDGRPLRRLLRAAVDCALSRAHTVDPGATTGGIVVALGRAAH